MPRLLIAEDDPRLADTIECCARLVWSDAVITIASSDQDALRSFATHQADLVILNLKPPPLNGLVVCQRIRERSSVPIMMLTGRRATAQTVRALDHGADDCLAKPFDALELQARLRALLRRAAMGRGSSADERLAFGALSIDLARRDVVLDNESISVTPTEYRLLTQLARHPGRVIPHDHLRELVWGAERFGDPSDVKVFVGRLRRKLNDNAEQPRFIENVWGVGYRFIAEARA